MVAEGKGGKGEGDNDYGRCDERFVESGDATAVTLDWRLPLERRPTDGGK